MSSMNRPGRSIQFVDRSIAPEMPRARPIAGLNLSSMETSPSSCPRRNAQLAFAPVLITTAACKRSALNSKLAAALTALPAWRAPSGTALLAPPRRRFRSPQAVSAPSRDDPLATAAQSAQQRARSRPRVPEFPPLEVWTDLTLLAGDSPDEFRDRSGDRIRDCCWFKPTSATT